MARYWARVAECPFVWRSWGVVDWEQMRFRSEETRPFKRLRGFDRSKGHFSPKFHSDAALRFLGRLLGPELLEEVSQVRDGIRQHFGFATQDLTLETEGDREWLLQTPAFGYRIEVGQGESPDQARIIREWSLGAEWSGLPLELGHLFPAPAEVMVLPLPAKVSFQQWVLHFEAMMRNDGGELEERDAVLCYRSGEGGEMTIDFNSGEWKVRPPQVYGFLEMARWLQGRPEAIPGAS